MDFMSYANESGAIANKIDALYDELFRLQEMRDDAFDFEAEKGGEEYRKYDKQCTEIRREIVRLKHKRDQLFEDQMDVIYDEFDRIFKGQAS